MAEPSPLDNVNPLVVLRLFEADVTHRRYQQAEECLLWLLQNASIFPLQQNKVFPPNYDEREVAYVATRLAAGLCQMFADPAFGVQDKDYHKWAMLHENMVAVLGVSGFGNADHVIQNLLEPIESQKVEEVTRQAFNKILLLHDSDSDVKIPYEDYLPSHPKHILWMMILAVGKLFCVTEKENTARNKLIEMLIDKIDINAFDQSMLGWISIAWMHCSYATTPARNKVKKTFNRMLVKWMESKGIRQSQMVASKKRNGKPVLLVVNEYFKVSHAMYRCYAPFIEALRKHFYVVGMTAKQHSDEESIHHFDEHHYIEWKDDVVASLRSLVGKIVSIAPSAVYYPSVGMNIASILLCNLRLASRQIVSLGHPASTFSDVIDYCVIRRGCVANADHFSEIVLSIMDEFTPYEKHASLPEKATRLSWRKNVKAGNIVRIAISGSSMKINDSFLLTLKQIEERSTKILEFNFFPNITTLAKYSFKKKTESYFKGYVKVHSPMKYEDYLREISTCHICLSPFPFSSTNSLVDSLVLGVPLVVLRVEEAEVATDAAIVERANIPDLVAANTVTQYIDIACDFINNEKTLQMVSDQLLNSDMDEIFFGKNGVRAEESASAKKSAFNFYRAVMVMPSEFYEDKKLIHEADLAETDLRI